MTSTSTPLALTFAALTLLRICGSDEADAPPPAEAPPTSLAVEGEVIPVDASEPAHGGTVVVAEDRPVEVVVGPGEVEAYLMGPQAAAESGAGTTITVDVQGDDGQTHTVPLAWQPAERRYYAVVPSVQPRPGPVVVHVVRGGRARVGRAPRVVVLTPARWRSPRRHRVVVRAPRPGRPHVDVHVHGKRPPHPGRPNVDVHIHGPRPPAPPRPHVDVHVGGGGHRGHGPRVRVHHDNGHHKGHGRGHGGGRGRGHGRH